MTIGVVMASYKKRQWEGEEQDDFEQSEENQAIASESDDEGLRRNRRKRRRKLFEGDPDQVYMDGDVVWARLEDFPWWPAKVRCWLSFFFFFFFVAFFLFFLQQTTKKKQKTKNKNKKQKNKVEFQTGAEDPGYPFSVPCRWFGEDANQLLSFCVVFSCFFFFFCVVCVFF